MPYPNVGAAKKDSFPTEAEGAPLTIAQINHLARIYDSIKEAGTADNPFAVAWTTWKGIYKKEGNKWVKKPRQASEGFSYCSELPIKLFEEDLAVSISEIQILRTGKWNHPLYGKFEITSNDLVLFKDNFENKVKRVDVAVDTEHFPEKGAAGWIKNLLLRGEEELWAIIEWTKWGVEAIKGKLFQYISPEFDFNYEDAETGKTYKNVLHAATLTNRPFLKDMAPVVLSEDLTKRFIGGILNEETENKPKGGAVDMELKELVGLVGLKEEATEEEFKTKLKEVSENVKTLKEGSKALVEIAKSLGLKEDAKVDEVSNKFKEILEKIKTLEKGKEGTVTLTENELNDLKKSAEDGKNALKQLNENKANKLADDAISAGKVTPKQKDWAQAYALKDPEGFKKFIEAAPVIVKLTEDGSQGEEEGKVDAKDRSEEGRKKLNERAEVILSEGKAKTYKEALDKARTETKE